MSILLCSISNTNTQFVSYLDSIKEPFSECLDEIESQAEGLDLVKNSIMGFESQTRDFTCLVAENKQGVSAQIPLYWNRINSPFVGCSNTSIQGYLWKRCGRFTGSWKRRFFMVSNCVISYAENVEEALRNSKRIQLVFCHVKPEPSQPRPHCFSITSKDRVLLLQALTDYDMNHWLAVIQNNISNQLQSQGLDISEQQCNQVDLYSKNICADCGAMGASWSSINFGVTICDSCAGIHRSLPPSLTRVRSLQLDEVELQHRLFVEAIGSEKANSVLEANIQVQKININSNTDLRRDFIRDKYLNKNFVIPKSVDVFQAIREQSIIAIYESLMCQQLTFVDGEFTPLHAASIIGNPIVFTMLSLNLKDLFNFKDQNNWYPLTYAVFYNHRDIVEILISFGADITTPNGPNLYAICESKGYEDLISKFEPIRPPEDSKADIIESAPSPDWSPQPFKESDYIDEKRLALLKPNMKTMPSHEKKKLRGALNSIRSRLSTGGHTASAIFKAQLDKEFSDE